MKLVMKLSYFYQLTYKCKSTDVSGIDHTHSASGNSLLNSLSNGNSVHAAQEELIHNTGKQQKQHLTPKTGQKLKYFDANLHN